MSKLQRTNLAAARVAETIELARQAGTNVRRQPQESYDNSVAENLEKSDFLRALWSSEVPGRRW